MPVRKRAKAVPKTEQTPVVVRRPRAHAPEREVCPKCGRLTARLIGRSETFPVLYLRCDDCAHTSIAPA
jgi:hypothetical protein